eukprot:UN25977
MLSPTATFHSRLMIPPSNTASALRMRSVSRMSSLSPLAVIEESPNPSHMEVIGRKRGLTGTVTDICIEDIATRDQCTYAQAEETLRNQGHVIFRREMHSGINISAYWCATQRHTS